MFDPKVVLKNGTTNEYGYAVLNPDGSEIGSGTMGTSSTYDQVLYVDDTDPTYKYEYICEANANTALTTAEWRVKGIRTTKASGDILVRFANGNTSFNKAATNLATVAAYTYLDF